MNSAIYYGLVLLLSCTRTLAIHKDGNIDGAPEFRMFSFWPSMHNAARLIRLRREANQSVPVESGVQVPVDTQLSKLPSSITTPSSASVQIKEQNKLENAIPTSTIANNGTGVAKVSSTTVLPVSVGNETKINNTSAEVPESKVDLSDPGVLKRGLIVFGGFALMAVAYFIFYKRKNSKNDTSNTHSAIDPNQFRYGVLQSEDRRDNMELSRVPLTMESDEDDDDDMEIFDLEQKKKSLSYVNLQTNDEDVVFPGKETSDHDRDNLLLDIDDTASETLINWSSNGSKSIL